MDMKNHGNWRRILSLFLCCCILLVVCACAAEEAKPPVSEREASSGESTLSLEQISQLVSESSSGTVSEPFVPNLTVPEERETVLEHIATLETGINGAFEYAILIGEDEQPFLSCPTPLFYCADESGNVYTDWVYNGQPCILRLNDGAYFLYSSLNDSTHGMVCCGDSIFVCYMDGSVNEFSIEGGIENGYLKASYPTGVSDSESLVSLIDIGEDEPLLRVTTSLDLKENEERSASDMIEEGSFLLYLEKGDGKGTLLPYQETFYTLAWEKVPVSELPYIPELETVESDCAVMRSDASRPYRVAQNNYGDTVKSIDGNGIYLEIGQYADTMGIGEYIYFSYDTVGNLLSKVMMIEVSDGYKPCSIPFTLVPGGEVTEYFADTVTVGETVFEDVLDNYIVSGRGGALYLVLYYPNEVELYRIDPGYSDVRLSDFTTIER